MYIALPFESLKALVLLLLVVVALVIRQSYSTFISIYDSSSKTSSIKVFSIDFVS